MPALLFLSTLLIAGLIAPLLYWIGNDFLTYPFHRYVNRSILIAALISLAIFWKHFRFTSIKAVGLRWRIHSYLELKWGFILGALTIGLAGAMEWFLHQRLYVNPITISIFIKSLIPALLVAPIEEFLFRGILQRQAQRSLGKAKGIILVSLVFSVAHFLKVPKDFIPDPVHWYSGWEAILHAFEPVLNLDHQWQRLVGLSLAGGILGVLALRTGSLWAPIGTHAAWIFFQQFITRTTSIENGSIPFWCANDIVSGGIALVLMTFALILLWKLLPQSPE